MHSFLRVESVFCTPIHTILIATRNKREKNNKSRAHSSWSPSKTPAALCRHDTVQKWRMHVLLGSRAKRMHFTCRRGAGNLTYPRAESSTVPRAIPRVQKCHNRAFRYVDKLFGLQIEVYVADSNFNPGKGQDNTRQTHTHTRKFHAAQQCRSRCRCIASSATLDNLFGIENQLAVSCARCIAVWQARFDTFGSASSSSVSDRFN